eukprot:6203609-Pleurochrysis_carterae.AAC.1
MVSPSEVLKKQSLDGQRKKKTHAIVGVEADSFCKDALELMVSHHILALPVIDSGVYHTPGGTYGTVQGKRVIGVIDMLDIVALMCKLHVSTSGMPPAYRYSHEWVEWNDAKVEQAVHEKKRSPEVISHHGSLADAARVMINNNVHRVLVCDDEHRLVDVVTQSDLVDALHAAIPSLDQTYLCRAISQFEVVQRDQEILSADCSTKAIEVFRLMDHNYVSAIPVIDFDRNRQLVGNISARDIRDVIREDDFPRSLYTEDALSFAQKMHTRRGPSVPPLNVSLKPTNTLGDVIETLNAFKIHRVWIVNAQGQVTHVLSLGDVLQEIMDH